MKWFGDILNMGPKRDGMFGIGGSGAKTDRKNQLDATNAAFNVYQQGLGNATTAEKSGQSDLSAATDYWRKLLSPGRTQATMDAAPQIQAAVSQGDAVRRQEGQFGTGRTGGTAADNQQAETRTNSTIDQIINENLASERKTAAEGLQSAGGTELSSAIQNLGISGSAVQGVMNNAERSYEFNTQQQEQLGASLGQAAAQLALLFA